MMTDFGFISIIRKTAQRVRRCQFEPLEHRIVLNATADSQAVFSSTIAALLATNASAANPLAGPLAGISYPGGVTVTDSQILTETETIPRFAAQPTIVSVQSGNWADPGIWSLGRVPTGHDRVAIAASTSVSYSTVSDAALDGLEISGSLTFSTSTNTRLTVANLTVMPTGTLQIGTATTPVVQGVTAEIVIANQPLDFVHDPNQYGTGFIALGTVSIHGAPLDQTWLGLAGEPRAGENTIAVAGDISGWRKGETLILPDTRQVLTSQSHLFSTGKLEYQDEEVRIDHLEGNRVYLTVPLQFDHLGAHNTNGGLELLPHVARSDRNVVIRSGDPGGNRGYTLFTARANVDIEYASFQHLGRTDAFRPLDDTTFDGQGNVTHTGTNQSGRYAVYFDHLMGPVNTTNTGYQFQFVGNTVDESMKWAVALNDSSYGLLSSNVIYDAQGAGFVTSAGSEIGNMFSGNITISIQGTYDDGATAGDYARSGSGFWFRRGGNSVVNNVATDSSYAGFVIDGYNATGSVTLPAFRGADTAHIGQGIVTNLNPAAVFANNDVYGLTTYGVWLAFISGNDLTPGQPQVTFSNLRIWNVFHIGVRAYHTSDVTFDNLLILGDESAQDRNDEGTRGMDLEYYENRNLAITNSRIEGVRCGIIVPNNDASQAGIPRPTIIQNTILKSYINILVTPGLDDRPSDGNSLVVRGVKFGLLPNLPNGPAPAGTMDPPANIRMKASGNNGENVDFTQPSVVSVYDYNQVPGDNFQVFYREQARGFIVPQTSASLLSGRNDGLIGLPEAGLTNRQSWQKYGIAIAGGVAPLAAMPSRPEINGLLGPLQDLSTASPRVVLVTPWNGAQIVGNQPVRIRYNVNGLMPVGGQVYFSLDGGTPFSQFRDGGLYNLPAGQHTLRAYIGGADGQQLPGTGPAASSSISVVIPPPSIDLNGPAAGTGFTANFVVGNGPVPIVDRANLTITDPSSATLVAAIATLINPQSGDVLSANTTGTSITATLVGTTLTFTGSDTVADYQQVLRSVTFDNPTLNPSVASRTILFAVTDSNRTDGTSQIATSTVVVPPIVDLNGAAAGTGFAANFVAGNGPVPIVDGNHLTVTDRASTTLVSAKATIVAPQSGDVLVANTTGTNISVQFDGATLWMTGSDVLAKYQQVLRSVTFDNTLLNPPAPTRTINFSVTDLTNTSPIATSTVSVLSSRIVGRMLFYHNSPRYDVTSASFPGFSDDNAIATDKSAYLPGSEAATFANVTAYSKGINGIMIDLQGGGSHGAITLANVLNDFTFKVGNDNGPGNWAAAPNPTSIAVRTGAGVGGSDRVELIWADGAIQQQWLEVTVKSNANTGLIANDIFFFGSEIGNTGSNITGTTAFTNSLDISDFINHGASIKDNIPITNIYDFNKDGRVGITDLSDTVNHGTTNKTGLALIDFGSGGPIAPVVVPAAASAPSNDGGMASSLASMSPSPTPTLSVIPTWIVNRLSQLDWTRGPVARYFERLAHENTPKTTSILTAAAQTAAAQAADALGLDDHLLDSLLATLELE